MKDQQENWGIQICFTVFTTDKLLIGVVFMAQNLTEVIKLLQQGEMSAFDEFYRSTNRAVYYRAYEIMRNAEDSHDIVQDTYLLAFRNIQSLKKPEAAVKWLCIIAYRLCVRKMKNTKGISFVSIDDEEQPMDIADDNRTPEEAADYEATMAIIRQMVDSLPLDQRLVATMFYFDEMSVAQIASALKLSENTIKSRLRYVRLKIEQMVRDEEKKGIKLYAITPIFLGNFFREAENGLSMPIGMEERIAVEVARKCGYTSTYTAPTHNLPKQGDVSKASNEVAKATDKLNHATKGARTAGSITTKRLGLRIAAGIIAGSIVTSTAATAITKERNLNRTIIPVTVETTTATEIQETEKNAALVEYSDYIGTWCTDEGEMEHLFIDGVADGSISFGLDLGAIGAIEDIVAIEGSTPGVAEFSGACTLVDAEGSFSCSGSLSFGDEITVKINEASDNAFIGVERHFKSSTSDNTMRYLIIRDRSKAEEVGYARSDIPTEQYNYFDRAVFYGNDTDLVKRLNDNVKELQKRYNDIFDDWAEYLTEIDSLYPENLESWELVNVFWSSQYLSVCWANEHAHSMSRGGIEWNVINIDLSTRKEISDIETILGSDANAKIVAQLIEDGVAYRVDVLSEKTVKTCIEEGDKPSYFYFDADNAYLYYGYGITAEPIDLFPVVSHDLIIDREKAIAIGKYAI